MASKPKLPKVDEQWARIEERSKFLSSDSGPEDPLPTPYPKNPTLRHLREVEERRKAKQQPQGEESIDAFGRVLPPIPKKKSAVKPSGPTAPTDPLPGYRLSFPEAETKFVQPWERPEDTPFAFGGEPRLTTTQRGPVVSGVVREEGEDVQDFLKRQQGYDESIKWQYNIGKQLRKDASMSSTDKWTEWFPKDRTGKGSEKAMGGDVAMLEQGLEAFRSGVEGAVSPIFQAAKVMGLDNATTQILSEGRVPDLTTKEQGEMFTKIMAGVGSTVPFAIAGAMPGVGTFASSLLGGMSQFGQTYQEAINAGQSEKDAKAAGTIGFLIGLTEAFGAGGAGKMFAPGMATIIRHALTEMTEEGAQEVIQQFLSNVNAKVLSGYDPKRAWMEGVKESAIIGGLVGFGMGGAVKMGQSLLSMAPVGTKPPSLNINTSPKAPVLTTAQVGEAINPKLAEFASGSKVVRPDGTPIKVYLGTQAGDMEVPSMGSDAMPGDAARGMTVTQSPNLASIMAKEKPYLTPESTLIPPFEGIDEVYTTVLGMGQPVPEGLKGLVSPTRLAEITTTFLETTPDLTPEQAKPLQDFVKYMESRKESYSGTFEGETPTVFPMYANIQNPLDLDAPLPVPEAKNLLNDLATKLRTGGNDSLLVPFATFIYNRPSSREAGMTMEQATAAAKENVLARLEIVEKELAAVTPSTFTGQKFVKSVESLMGDTRSGNLTNSLLSLMGFDGTTQVQRTAPEHSPTFAETELDAALNHAKEVDGELRFDKATGRYQVTGHRSWTVFSPNQLKSEWSLGFDKGSPRISAHMGERVGAEERFMEGSVVRYDDGTPITLYHGTRAGDIDALDFERLDPEALYGKGFYMTQDPNIASRYSETKELTHTEQLPPHPNENFLRDIFNKMYHMQALTITPQDEKSQPIPPLNPVKDLGDVQYQVQTYLKGLDSSQGGEEFLVADGTSSDSLNFSSSTFSKKDQEFLSKYDSYIKDFARYYGIDAYDIGYFRGARLVDINNKSVLPLRANIKNPLSLEPESLVSPETAGKILPNLERFLNTPEGDSIIEKVLQTERKLSDSAYGISPSDIKTKLLKDIDELTFNTAVYGEPLKGLDLWRFINDFGRYYGITNDLIKGMGFDGLTHLGGYSNLTTINPDTKTEFASEEEAYEYAEKVGGLFDYSSTGYPAVRGHRVWIAFSPEQVKSKWSLGFDPTSTRLSAQLDPTLPEHELFLSRVNSEEDIKLIKLLTTPDSDPRKPVTISLPARLFNLVQNVRRATTASEVSQKVKDVAELRVSPIWGTTIEPHQILLSLNQAGIAKFLSPEVRTAVTQVVNDAIKLSKDRGFSEIAMVNGANQKWMAKTILHEFFHVAQRQSADKVWTGSIWDLHSPDLLSNPILNKAANSAKAKRVFEFQADDLTDIPNPFSLLVRKDVLAVELPAYIASGEANLYDLTDEEGIDYLLDYFEDIVSTRGGEALKPFISMAPFKPEFLAPIARQFRGRLNEKATKSIDRRNIYGQNPLRAETPFNVGQTLFTASAAGPPLPPSAPPPQGPDDEGTSGEPNEPVYVETLNKFYLERINDAFIAALTSGGLKLKATDPRTVTEQVLTELANGNFQLMEDVEAILDQEGLTMTALADFAYESVSNAGKMLQEQSRLVPYLEGLRKTNPDLFKKLAPTQMQLKVAIRDLSNGVLGQTSGERTLNQMRQMMLTRLSTAFTQVFAGACKIPFSAIEFYTRGAAMAVRDLDFTNLSTMEAMKEVHAAGARQLKTITNLSMIAASGAKLAARGAKRITGAKPYSPKMNDWIDSPTSLREGDELIKAIESYFPTQHSKLFGVEQGPLQQGVDGAAVAAMRSLYETYAKTSPKKAAELLPEVKKLEAAYRRNIGLTGKVFRGLDFVYEPFTRPLSAQEFVTRRPIFLGSLESALERKGIDFRQLLADPTLMKNVSPAVIEQAVNDALEFTHAYNPKKLPGILHAGESAATHIMALLKIAGPASTLITAFPRAVYNSARFAWQYSPLGAPVPLAVSFNAWKEGGKADVPDEAIMRLAKAAAGTALYLAAVAIRKFAGGEEWWQVKTGLKDKNSNPVYLDARLAFPVAFPLWVVDFIERSATGRAHGRSSLDFLKLIFNIRNTDEVANTMIEFIDSMAKHWDTGGSWSKSTNNAIGNLLSLPLTPFQNLHDLRAQFDEEVKASKDWNEAGVWGPSLYKLEGVNNMWMWPGEPRVDPAVNPPLYQPLTQTAPYFYTEFPLLRMLGMQTQSGGNFASREMIRLGLVPTEYVKGSKDPIVTRARNEYFSNALVDLSFELSQDTTYLEAPVHKQQQILESRLDIIGKVANAMGRAANPLADEAQRYTRGMSRLEKEYHNVDKAIKDFNKPSDSDDIDERIRKRSEFLNKINEDPDDDQ